MSRKKSNPKKRTLTRERVLKAAVELADKDGVESLSMRSLGQALGVEAMSLYNHVANKDDLLDAIVELVVSEISDSTEVADWKAAMRSRAIATHRVLLRHPWVSSLLESRTRPIPGRLQYFNSTVGMLREAGFSTDLAYYSFLTVDSFVYGFTFQVLNWPFKADDRPKVVKRLRTKISVDEYPHIVDVMDYVAGAARSKSSQVGYEREFEFGLELILDGLEQRRDRAQRQRKKRTS